MSHKILSYFRKTFDVSYNHQKYDNLLQDPDNKFWRRLNKFIVLLVIISVLILVFESIWDIEVNYRNELFIADFFISTIFLYEYFYRFIRSKEKISFVANPLNIVDLLSFLPFFIWLIFSPLLSTEVLKVFRLIRIFRVLKLVKNIHVLVWFIKALKDYKWEYKAVGILFSIILTIVSILVYHVEYLVNPDFATIPDALWWWLVTMSTVWYGDIYPITITWRIIWSVLIILWPVLLALMSAITILVFMDVIKRGKIKKQKKERMKCKRCSRKNRKSAHFCMRCGEDLR